MNLIVTKVRIVVTTNKIELTNSMILIAIIIMNISCYTHFTSIILSRMQKLELKSIEKLLCLTYSILSHLVLMHNTAYNA